MKKIYYVMDVLCGWCYGISDEINGLYEEYKDKIEFEIIPGGMWTGNYTQKMNKNLAAYIIEHNGHIEKISGKRFGVGFNSLLQTEIVLDSMPGSKALTLAKTLDKNKVFSYLKEIQNAFFVEGRDIRDKNLYVELAEKVGYDKDLFNSKWDTVELEKETQNAFAKVRELGVRSFPTVILDIDGNLSLLNQGYATKENMKKSL